MDYGGTKLLHLYIRVFGGKIKCPSVINSSALVLKNITDGLPLNSFSPESYSFLKGLPLADPTFNISSRIDLLLSVTIFVKVLGNEKVVSSDGLSTAIKSDFGWLVGGTIPSDSLNSVSLLALTDTLNSEADLRMFWEIEMPITSEIKMSLEEKAAEEHFVKICSKNDSGRFVLRLPFKSLNFDFSHSRNFVFNRLLSMEKQFVRNGKLKLMYVEFLRKYEKLTHMEKLTTSKLTEGYYLPHHGVLRESSTTTKLRVVFDGTSTFSSKHSLNQFLLPGPKLQNEILDILLRFRTNRIAFITDVEKMFRQIEIAQEDQCFLKILWRESPDLPIDEYKSRTVTYGTTCAPFQANRVLRQIASEVRDTYPEASRIILQDSYIDDIVSGAGSLPEAMRYHQESSSALNGAQLSLRKWMSNNQEFLQHINPELRYFDGSVNLLDCKLKVLGIKWTPIDDTFGFSVNVQF